MDKNTYIFIGIILLLAVSSYFMNEAFTDASGASVKDGSGGYVTVSISDLFAILMSKEKQATPLTQTQQPQQQYFSEQAEPSFERQFASLKGSIMSDVRQTLRDELQSKREGTVLNDSCIDSVVNQQGNEWMRYIPGKNPADYIRKDSIPCYACNLN